MYSLRHQSIRQSLLSLPPAVLGQTGYTRASNELANALHDDETQKVGKTVSSMCFPTRQIFVEDQNPRRTAHRSLWKQSIVYMTKIISDRQTGNQV
jgi:hypothetical protein